MVFLSADGKDPQVTPGNEEPWGDFILTSRGVPTKNKSGGWLELPFRRFLGR